jgi:hypothetical protein
VSSGSIGGTVRDPQNAIVRGAAVTAEGADVTHTFATDGDGSFRFLNLAPGRYRLRALLAGFEAAEREVIVSVGRHVEVPIQFRVAAVSDSVTVLAAAPIVDATASGTASNFTIEDLDKIPASRDPFALVRAVPGVLLDRVNVGGNETGQQPLVVAKGSRQQDTTLMLDGVEITDMGAAGQSPTYFNFDNFEEVHVSTAGHDIAARTGGVNLDFIVKRGTNQYRAAVRGYLTGEGLESSNVPDELAALAAPVTPATADHTKQISDYGFEVGGPLARDRAWFYASYSEQDIRLVRRAGAVVDRTRLENPTLKVNWQAGRRDLVNFLFFNGSKIKDYRSPGIVLYEAPTATFHQDNAYSDFPLHGLWKIGDDRVFGPNLFLSAKYAYYNTGNALTPMGGMDSQAGLSLATSQTFGSFQRAVSARPQHTVRGDLNWFVRALGATHDVRLGAGFRKVDVYSENMWPGNGIWAIEVSPADRRAQVFRQGNGGNRVEYLHFHAGDTVAWGRMTLDLGARFDRQWGEALPSQTLGNRAFPDMVPGVLFPGYRAPFTWNTVSPRAGVSYAVDDSGRTVARAGYSRYVSQLSSTTVGYMNPSSSTGSMTFRWIDANQDHFAQADEVQLDQQVGGPGGGFNPANPTAVTSANRLDPDLAAPVTQTVVAGVDHELMRNLTVGAHYTYTRTGNLFGNLTGNITPRVGVSLADYAPGPAVEGSLADGTPYSVPTFVPDAARVAAGGGGFLLTNVPGYVVDYHGLELTLVKRLSGRWMGRLAFSYNNAREHFGTAEGRYDTNGNPTRTVAEPLVDGGQHAPQASPGVYLNAKWQFAASGMHQTAYGLEVAASVFGRQGYPFPVYRSQTLGADTLSVLLTPLVDTYRLPSVWNTDLRIARSFRLARGNIRLVGDLFNVFNANTALVRNHNLASPTFNQIVQNLSPRIFRAGVVVGF